ncbi:hypothetical protein [Aquamicrobium terrae]|uniref:Uncharacterized protein n=1 Tax=Aquamicrobium terrae TaxID=1324945 RepID=A0ABV2N7C4_9HYPH
MPKSKGKKPAIMLPDIKPGNWRGEILGSRTVNFGQVVQPGPPRQSVEFTYMIMPAAITMPEARFTWLGVIMIMTPTPMKTEFPDAGCLFKAKHLPPLHLSLEVTRGQFSDMLRMLETKRLRNFHFTLEDEPTVHGRSTVGACQPPLPMRPGKLFSGDFRK